MDTKPNKSAQRTPQTASEMLEYVLLNSIVYNDWNGETSKAIEALRQFTASAIPIAWIEEQRDKSSGFRHAVLSETLEKWEGERRDESNE